MKKLVGFAVIYLSICLVSIAQVDTTEIYNASKPYGALDIRIAKSATQYYYLQENITKSFRESSPGVKTNTFYDMTSWDSSPYTQGNMREKVGTKDNFVMNYRLLFPKNYTTSYTEGYPLIVMMHGAGERGNCWDTNCYFDTRSWNPITNNPAAPTAVNSPLLNNDQNLVHGGGPHLDARNLAGNRLPDDLTMPSRAFPGFVLFPQNLNGWDVSYVQQAIKLIRLAVKKYNIDPNRIYIHGLSNGGAAVYEALKRAPWLFSAALPMSAISDGGIIAKGMIPKVATTPIWTFQGGKDTSPNPFKTEGYVKTFRENGMDVRYTLYPNLGHGTWNTAYSEPDFFTWILSKNKSKVHVFYNNPVICGTTGQGAKLGYSFGFLAYQWEKDGQIIADATGAEYIATTPGVYRARFSRFANPTEAQWNKWSQPVTVTFSNPPQASITVIGTTCMRGPDNNAAYNTVKLRSDNKNDHYYWYKNGVLVNIPSNTIDDTVRVYTITTSSTTGSGSFTLLNKGNDNCPSTLSDPLNLYFGNSAPFLTDDNIPSNFQGSAVSPSAVDVSWNDNSSIETTYEIWRKKTGGIYALAGKTASNATSFHDTGLEPSTTYNYKIRAVNGQGRSKYAPSDNVSVNLVITTLEDTEAPTTPQNFIVVSNTVNSINLSWTASTDNTGIRNYVISYGANSVTTPSNATTFNVTGLTLNTTYAFTVEAVDLAGLHSSLSNVAIGTTHVTGLIYGHSTGAWNSLDAITTWSTPEFTGQVPNFTLSPRTQEDFFYFQFDGYINITTAGNYQFRTTSDDGSRLALRNVVIVNNDGLHGNVTVTSGLQTLSSGPYPINVKYFEYTGGQTLIVEYLGPDTGGLWKVVPDAVLNSGTSNIFPARSALASTEVEEESNTQQESFVVQVYPSPSTSDNINVRVQSVEKGLVQVRLIDTMGKSLYENSFSKEDAAEGVKVSPRERLTAGMYIIVVNHGNGHQRKEKVMIKN
jgi:hypothetical protein